MPICWHFKNANIVHVEWRKDDEPTILTCGTGRPVYQLCPLERMTNQILSIIHDGKGIVGGKGI